MHLSFSLLAIAYVVPILAHSDGLQVQTPQGPVVGTSVNSNVRQFLGIPFATAGRWEAPQLPPHRSKTFSATKFGDSCVQSFTPSAVEFLRLAGADNSTIFVPESENCLTVNIWAPSLQRKQNAAVLLWVYGGAFQFGTSNIPTYNGQYIVEENDDILVVTFNYRLNIFGFPNAPQMVSSSKSQNFGLLDLDAVVEWVHNNIAAFGGDPSRITLFGQSAGGAAIDAYTFAHPKDTRVKDSSARAAAGNFLRVPLLSGTTQHEGDIFIVGAELVAAGVAVPCLTEILADLETQVGFTCPTGTTALGRVNAHTPTWRYQYQGGATLPNFYTVFSDISSRPDIRAYHASEIPLIYGTMPNPTSQEKALSRFIQGAWVAFARNPTRGLTEIGWPQYSPNTSTLAQIGGPSKPNGLSFTQGQLLDFTCGSVSTLKAASAQLTALL
ncbi:hypothetical protein H0H93_011127 [Arthromyces matolae]|nr:hypothetical protein H0H93_011127 [Arthromyces matolae]